ncbi:hypothetical protein BMS3Bbin04_02138 [bacterium BMS3Bbin04]|nr:hypothetical protein BMS3Bbin04_02138 [bacterium BMS3Bbin04]
MDLDRSPTEHFRIPILDLKMMNLLLLTLTMMVMRMFLLLITRATYMTDSPYPLFTSKIPETGVS